MKEFILRMKARRKKMKGKKEFKQAAFAYMGLKVTMIVLTYAFFTCNNCLEGSQLIRQGIHLILFSHFIYAGMRITTSILGFTCLFRASAYFINFFLKKSLLLTLPLTGTTLSVLREDGAGNWIFLINSLIIFAISFMIFRALKARFAKQEDLAVSEMDAA